METGSRGISKTGLDSGKTKTLRVVALSDLHGYLPRPEEFPECDVACCCGDFVPLEYQNDDVASIAWFCLEFIPWVDKLPCKKFILVSGNHDFFMDPKRSFANYIIVSINLSTFETTLGILKVRSSTELLGQPDCRDGLLLALRRSLQNISSRCRRSLTYF